jgi:CheY-like chemotaxis protein/HPt (histidine-containing phosphotransfer) domain-containing protein
LPDDAAPNVTRAASTTDPTVNREPLNLEPRTVKLRFMVRDTGIGIPEEKLGLLFQSFSQVDASVSRKFGGTGLGLAISKQLVEIMGGEIGVESTLGQGTTFWFTVRLDLARDASVLPPPTGVESVRTLIVDDRASSRETLLTTTLAWGMRAEEVLDGPAAISLLYRGMAEYDPFRLLLVDLEMPVMDGETLGKIVHADPKLQDLRTVLLAPMERTVEADRWHQAGYWAVLGKPVLHAELRQELERVMASNSPEDAYDSPTTDPAREALRPTFISGARILLADDNPTNRKVALAMLLNLGLVADVVVDGQEAVQALQQQTYDLVLMNVQMPVMDGLEATRRIRIQESEVRSQKTEARDGTMVSGAQTSVIQVSGYSPQPSLRRIPIIALTAHAMAEDRGRCLAVGMDDYLTKPLDPDDLLRIVQKWLPGRLPATDTPPATGTLAPQANTEPVDDPATTSEAVQPEAPASRQPAKPTDTVLVFNQADLLRRLGDNTEVASRLREIFLDSTPERLHDVERFLEAGDAGQIRHALHTLRGASANIGGEALLAAIQDMEPAGRDNDLDRVRALLSALKTEYARLVAMLEVEMG